MQPTCSISASQNPAPYGQSVTLSWTSTDAVSATLNGEPVDPSGTKEVTASIDGEDFQLDVYGDEGEMANANVSLGVIYPQVQAKIAASALLVCPGTQVIIKWWTQNATQVQINGEDVSPSGEMTVIPSGSENYELHAYGVDASMATDSVTVELYEDEGITLPPWPGSGWSQHHVTFTPSVSSLVDCEIMAAPNDDGHGGMVVAVPGDITTDLPEAIQYFPFIVPLHQVGRRQPQPAWNPAWAHPNCPPWVNYTSLQRAQYLLNNWPSGYPAGSTANDVQQLFTSPGWPAGHYWNRHVAAQPGVVQPPPIQESGLVDDSGNLAMIALQAQAGLALARWITGRAAAILAQPPMVMRIPAGSPIPATVPPNTIVVIIGSADDLALQQAEWAAIFANRVINASRYPPMGPNLP